MKLNILCHDAVISAEPAGHLLRKGNIRAFTMQASDCAPFVPRFYIMGLGYEVAFTRNMALLEAITPSLWDEFNSQLRVTPTASQAFLEVSPSAPEGISAFPPLQSTSAHGNYNIKNMQRVIVLVGNWTTLPGSSLQKLRTAH